MLNKKGSENRLKKKKLRGRETKKPTDRDKRQKKKPKDRGLRLNKRLKDRELRPNKRLKDREKKRSIRNWNLINTGTIKVLEKPIASGEYSTELNSMKI
jgi:hypothetical protein